MIKFIQSISLAILFCLSSCTSWSLSHGQDSFQKQDYRKAFILLMPAAKSGNADAQYAIGYMYYYGQGTVRSHEKAVHWMTLAANQGHADAIKALRKINRAKSFPYAPSSNPKLRPL